jgi:copper chaperone CopZ
MKTSVLAFTIVGLIGLSGSIAYAQVLDLQMPAEVKDGEVSQDVRDQEVVKQLTGTSDTVLVYAEGLCCPSCSSGVKKYVGELAFVKKSEGKSSVQIDAKHQLVRIELKPNSAVDMKELSHALNEAGYPAIHLYALKKGKVVTQVFEDALKT